MKGLKTVSLNRRELLRAATGIGGCGLLAAGQPDQNESNAPTTVRDRFWMYGQEADALYGRYGLPGKSYITAAEAAIYLSVPNLIFGFCHREPETLSTYRQLAIPFRPFKRVVWSIVRCSGKTNSHDRDSVLKLVAEMPNMTGVIMDDFFRGPGVGALNVEELREVQRRLRGAGKKLDLWVVLYDHQLETLDLIRDHLALCDVITFWVWKGSDLERLEPIFAKFEKLMPQARKVLGCYMYDFGQKKQLPVSTMKLQCELALEWIQHGRIEGMIFDESNFCDFGFDAVEWSREWIRKVGDQKLSREALRARGAQVSG